MKIEQRYLSWLAVIFSVFALAAYSLYIQPWMLDDAFISFRYAENLAAGNGLVYNVGERVEGYTCFLWIILLAVGKWAGADIVAFSKVLGIIFAVGSLILLANAHRFIKEIDYKVSAIAVFMLGSTGVFLPWAVSGMEVMLFTFLILLANLYYIYIIDTGEIEKFSLLGLLCGLTTLARPEGLIVFAAIIVHYLFYKGKGRPAIYFIGFFLAVFLPYFVWRYSYYGFLLPNTFYAKVGLTHNQIIRGLKYIFRFLVPALMILLPLIDPPSLFGWFRKYRGLYILPILIGGFTSYIIAVGGDSMPALRFFTPVIPIICLMSSMSLISMRNTAATIFIVCCVILYNFAVLGTYYYITRQIEIDQVVEHGREVGLWMRDNVSSDAVLATNTAGSIPFYSKLTIIDMLGLNDLHIAHRHIPKMGSGPPGHEKSDGAYVLSRRPDYIQFATSRGSIKPVFPGDFELYEIPEFSDDYAPTVNILPSGAKLYLYKKRDDISYRSNQSP
jgi:hypothetical protein